MFKAKLKSAKGAWKLLFAVFFSLLALPGCRRKEIIENTTTRLTRNWQLVQSATDDNGNGTIDAYEFVKLQDNFLDYYKFNTDNSGTESVTATNGITTQYPFTWIQTADTLDISRTGNNVEIYYVKSLSNVQMELITNTPRGLAGYLFDAK